MSDWMLKGFIGFMSVFIIGFSALVIYDIAFRDAKFISNTPTPINNYYRIKALEQRVYQLEQQR